MNTGRAVMGCLNWLTTVVWFLAFVALQGLMIYGLWRFLASR
jgi:hypothetical protein